MAIDVGSEALPERRQFQRIYKVVRSAFQPTGENYNRKRGWSVGVTQWMIDYLPLSFVFEKDGNVCPVCGETDCPLQHRGVRIFGSPEDEAAYASYSAQAEQAAQAGETERSKELQQQANAYMQGKRSPLDARSTAYNEAGCPVRSDPSVLDGLIFIGVDGEKKYGKWSFYDFLPETLMTEEQAQTQIADWAKEAGRQPDELPVFRRGGRGDSDGSAPATPADALPETKPQVPEAEALTQMAGKLAGNPVGEKAPMVAAAMTFGDPWQEMAFAGTLGDELVKRGALVDQGGVYQLANPGDQQ